MNVELVPKVGCRYLSEMPWKVVEFVKAHGCKNIAINLANNLGRKNTRDGVHLSVVVVH